MSSPLSVNSPLSVSSPRDLPPGSKLKGVESILRRTVEVPEIEEKIVKVQRTLTVTKRVPKIEIKEVEKVVEKIEYDQVEKIVEVPQIQTKITTVPKIIQLPYESIVEKLVEGPVQYRYIDKIKKQPKIVHVQKEVKIPNVYKSPDFQDSEVPILAMQKIHPIVKFDENKTRPLRLKRYHPKCVPVEVEVEITPEEMLAYMGVDVESLETTEGTAIEEVNGVNCCFSRRHESGVQLKMSYAAKRVTVDEWTSMSQTHSGVGSSSARTPIYPSHYNSWLLYLNYHLVNQQEIMKSLPWIRDYSRKIPFLPAGTPLPGAVMDREVARRVGIEIPAKVEGLQLCRHPPACFSTSRTQHSTVSEKRYPLSEGRSTFDHFSLYERERAKAVKIMKQAIGA